MFFLQRGRVVAFVGDHRGCVASLADADEDLLRGEGSFGHAAKTLEAEEPARFDPADNEAELVHVGEQHHARPDWVAFSGRDQVPESIRHGCEAKATHLRAKAAAHAAFVSADARNQHELHCERPQTVEGRFAC
jgi:hypothetical protein